jgi:hypothetical protein
MNLAEPAYAQIEQMQTVADLYPPPPPPHARAHIRTHTRPPR